MDEAPVLRHPGVRFPPPLLFVGGLAVGWLLARSGRVSPLHIAAAGPAGVIGGAVLLAGLALMAAGLLTFVRARTAINPNRPASRLVSTGPYRFSRNPIYTGLILAYAGGALLINSWWPIVFLPIVIWLLLRFVVSREETYLAGAFGAEYAAYRARVGRFF